MKPKENSHDQVILTVSVEDEGIGMSPEDVARVFNGPLLHLNSERESLNPYGNGIGLSFCKQVCQSVDGDISVESILGMGSRFTFTMGMKIVENYQHPNEQPHITEE